MKSQLGSSCCRNAASHSRCSRAVIGCPPGSHIQACCTVPVDLPHWSHSIGSLQASDKRPIPKKENLFGAFLQALESSALMRNRFSALSQTKYLIGRRRGRYDAQGDPA
jgi:hypothetical protein